ncbi:MAG: PAS domain S-box protein, partial [Methylococcaceae bacterium]
MMEAIFLIGLVILFGQIIFLDLLHDSIGPVAKDYWMFLVFAFVAVRLGSRGTVIALVVVAVQALSGAIQGIGYFADDIAKIHLVNYWFYLLTLSITSMALATYFTEKKQMEEALIARNERFQKLFDRASDGIVILSPSGKLVNANESFARMHGYTTEEIRTMNMKDLDAPEALELLPERMQHLLSGEFMTFEVENYHKDGHVFPLEVSASLIFIDGKPLIQSFVRDITERKQAEKKLNLAASVFTYAREGIMIAAADGSIIDVNDAFSRITGYSLDEIQGRNPQFLSSGRQGKEFYVSMWRDLIEQGNWCGEIWNRHKNGEVYAVLQTISAVRGDHGNIRQYVELFSDISLLKERERKLEHIAHFDALTDLPNCVLLTDRLHQGMAQAQRRERLLAVAFLDLADIEASVPMLTRLLAAAAQPVQVGELVLQVSASLGVTFYPQAEDIDADQLLRQADQAMYQA